MIDVGAILEAAGSSLDRLVSAAVVLAVEDDFGGMNFRTRAGATIASATSIPSICAPLLGRTRVEVTRAGGNVQHPAPTRHPHCVQQRIDHT
jgi:enamine deaminase RidA (YjgF/YER057c/UK114 family)